MTGLLNRNGFNLQLEEYLEGNKQKNCVGILLDVDNFKFINDVYGHTIGDQVLLQLSQSLVQAFPDNSIIARNGGDEFCIILKDCSAEEAAPMIDAFSKASRSFQPKASNTITAFPWAMRNTPPTQKKSLTFSVMLTLHSMR